jgi:hypothetical protein
MRPFLAVTALDTERMFWYNGYQNMRSILVTVVREDGNSSATAS